VFGEITLARQPVVQRASAGLFALAATGAGALLFYPHADKVRAPGVIEGTGQVAVIAPAAGVVARVAAADGVRVVPGDTLFVLDHRRGVISGVSESALRARGFEELLDGVAQARARALRAHVRETEELRQRIAHLEILSTSLGGEASLSGERLRLQQRELARIESLAGDGLVAVAVADERRERALLARLELLRVEREHMETRQLLAASRDRFGMLDLELGERLGRLDTEASGHRQGLAMAHAADETRIEASVAGRVTLVSVRPGEAVQAGRMLASVVPDHDPARLVVLVPAREMAGLASGMRVTFSYPGDGARLGVGEGMLGDMSLAPGRPDALWPWFAPGEPVYRAEATVERFPGGEDGPVGAVVVARIVRASTPLWRWLGQRLAQLVEQA
jgi:membrane fusion protein